VIGVIWEFGVNFTQGIFLRVSLGDEKVPIGQHEFVFVFLEIELYEGRHRDDILGMCNVIWYVISPYAQTQISF
jgi:hypothetical protein